MAGHLDMPHRAGQVPAMLVTRIRPLSLARVTTVIYAAIGLFIGAIFAVMSLVGAAVGFTSPGHGEPWFGALFGVGALVAAPIFYGVLGFLGGLFTALVYNLTARALGGVELDVVDR
jgi:hypothetical protein